MPKLTRRCSTKKQTSRVDAVKAAENGSSRLPSVVDDEEEDKKRVEGLPVAGPAGGGSYSRRSFATASIAATHHRSKEDGRNDAITCSAACSTTTTQRMLDHDKEKEQMHPHSIDERPDSSSPMRDEHRRKGVRYPLQRVESG